MAGIFNSAVNATTSRNIDGKTKEEEPKKVVKKVNKKKRGK